jgi:hypothetical protein
LLNKSTKDRIHKSGVHGVKCRGQPNLVVNVIRHKWMVPNLSKFEQTGRAQCANFKRRAKIVL